MGVYRSIIVVLNIKIGPIGGRILPQVINIAGFADFFPIANVPISTFTRSMKLLSPTVTLFVHLDPRTFFPILNASSIQPL